ncbi:MAG: hypothetical protein GXO91_09570 [FCB group bacterium]|nr:hypothetical protein [FCB group bacterium]
MSLFRIIIFFLLGYWLLRSIADYLKGRDDDHRPRSGSPQNRSGRGKSTRTADMDIQDADYEDIE